jgi:protein-S-isoprenylcysteine O-methyltransferase Ste14
MRSRPTRLFPPAYFLIALVAILLVEWLVPGSRLRPPLTRWHAVVPLVALAAGLGLFVTTVVSFRRHRAPLRPFRDPGVLMTGGTFRFSRNPIYLGMTLVLVSAAMFVGRPYLLLVPLLFAIIIQERFIKAEEEFLTENFGDAYRAYCARVRRWL